MQISLDEYIEKHYMPAQKTVLLKNKLFSKITEPYKNQTNEEIQAQYQTYFKKLREKAKIVEVNPIS
mgnify:CR=1 FL=1